MKKRLNKYKEYFTIKIYELIQDFFPANRFYKPSGIYDTSKEFITAVEGKEAQSGYIEIYSNLVSTLDVSEEFNKICFLPLKQVETSFAVTAIEKGRLYSNHGLSFAVISQDNHLIGDISFAYNYGRVAAPEENIILHQKYFKKPKQYKGVMFSMLSGLGAINNYGHWLIDTLPRLHLLKESGWFDKVDWFVVPNYKHDYQKDTLKLLGIDESKIIDGNHYLHLQASVLLASTAPRGNYSILPQWCCDFLRNSFLNKATLTSSYPPLVYISRRDSLIRRVLNEDEVVALLEPYGFKTYTLSNLPFIEKVKLFASADVIVSAAGAGMVNTVFCKKNAKILEIFGETMLHTDTYDKANKVGLEYFFLSGSKENQVHTNLDVRSLHEHVMVDIHKLKQKLDTYIFKKNDSLVEK
jgi:hypothetical protein